MPLEHHPLIHEFPEHRDRIHTLKESDHHFARLFAEYHDVDKEVLRMEEEIEPAADDVVEEAKKRRLKLKDELFAMLTAK